MGYKEDWPRPYKGDEYRRNYERIFGEKTVVKCRWCPNRVVVRRCDIPESAVCEDCRREFGLD